MEFWGGSTAPCARSSTTSMPGAPRKRLRGEAPAPLVAPGIRQILARRVDPHTARSPQIVEGLGVDDALVHLGRNIATALEALAKSAEDARVQLRESRAVLHAAIDARCDELGESINTTEARKSASLERELVAVDAALGSWRADGDVVREAVASLSDTELASQYAALSSRLDDMEAQLQALPTAVVEPPRVGLLIDAPATHTRIADFGRVLAPLPVTAADLTLEDESSTLREDRSMQLYLLLGARHDAQSAEELEVSLGTLVGTTLVEGTLEGAGIKPRSVAWSLVPNAAERCVCISFEVPPPFSSVHIRRVTVAGLPIAGFPLTHFMRQRIQGPLQIKGVNIEMPPCISPEGHTFCLSRNGSAILVFDSDRTPLPGISASRIGVLSGAIWAAYVSHIDSPALVVAEAPPERAGRASHIVAIDPTNRSARWTSTQRNINGYCGIAALPLMGVVLVSSIDHIFAHRLSDGVCVGKLKVVAQNSWNLAADSSTGTLFGTIEDVHYNVTVLAWTCADDGTGGGVRLTSAGSVAGVGRLKYDRPLAVVPPAPGQRTSHLVIGCQKSSELLVLKLPSRSLVHTHHVAGMSIVGLAADPGGGAIAVCDEASRALHILPWPLPGMLPFE